MEVFKEDLANKTKEGEKIEQEEKEKREILVGKQEKTAELSKKKQEKELLVWEKGKNG